MDSTITHAAPPTVSVSKTSLWVGRIMSFVPALLLIFSGVMKLVKPAAVVEGFAHLGWPDNLALPLGIVEIGCAVIYLVPQTAVLGAILITGYMGGAIATHVRLGKPIYIHILIGVIVWGGVYLRDPRLRALIPLRRVPR